MRKSLCLLFMGGMFGYMNSMVVVSPFSSNLVDPTCQCLVEICVQATKEITFTTASQSIFLIPDNGDKIIHQGHTHEMPEWRYLLDPADVKPKNPDEITIDQKLLSGNTLIQLIFLLSILMTGNINGIKFGRPFCVVN